MAAAEYNLVVEQGATFNKVITYKDSNGTPINLTGYTAKMDIREGYNTSTSIISLNTTNSMITLGGDLGTISLLITAANTTLLKEGMYVYDLFIINGTTITKLLKGQCVVDPRATKQ